MTEQNKEYKNYIKDVCFELIKIRTFMDVNETKAKQSLTVLINRFKNDI